MHVRHPSRAIRFLFSTGLLTIAWILETNFEKFIDRDCETVNIETHGCLFNYMQYSSTVRASTAAVSKYIVIPFIMTLIEAGENGHITKRRQLMKWNSNVNLIWEGKPINRIRRNENGDAILICCRFRS